jgi:hypothetical protein
MTLTLPVGSILYLDTSNTDTPSWVKLSEHNRSPVSLDTQRIERSQRMANGSLRKIFIADKKNISTSWSMLPSYSTMTVDAGYGAADLKSFYHGKGTGAFKVKISYNGVSGRDEILTAVFTSCSFTVVKRNVKSNMADVAQEFWDVSISLEEV